MSKKSLQRHENALNQLQSSVLDFPSLWDKGLFLAVEAVAMKTTSSHTLKSKSNSLLSLIRTHIDPALLIWEKENSEYIEWRFSDIVQMDDRHGFDTLSEFGRQNSPDWMSDSKILSASNLLIFLFFFCRSHSSESASRIYLDPNHRQSKSMPSERIGKGFKTGARSNGKRMQVASWVSHKRDDLMNMGFCQACGDTTSARIEFEVVTDPEFKLDSEVKKKIKKSGEFSSKTKGSIYFCPAHSERDAGSNAYKKGRAQVDLFLSILTALSYKGVAGHLNPLFPISFNLNFAKMAIRDNASYGDIKIIAESLKTLSQNRLEKIASDKLKKEMLESVRRIYSEHLKLKAMPAP